MVQGSRVQRLSIRDSWGCCNFPGVHLDDYFSSSSKLGKRVYLAFGVLGLVDPAVATSGLPTYWYCFSRRDCGDAVQYFPRLRGSDPVECNATMILICRNPVSGLIHVPCRTVCFSSLKPPTLSRFFSQPYLTPHKALVKDGPATKTRALAVRRNPRPRNSHAAEAPPYSFP